MGPRCAAKIRPFHVLTGQAAHSNSDLRLPDPAGGPPFSTHSGQMGAPLLRSLQGWVSYAADATVTRPTRGTISPPNLRSRQLSPPR